MDLARKQPDQATAEAPNLRLVRPHSVLRNGHNVRFSDRARQWFVERLAEKVAQKLKEQGYE